MKYANKYVVLVSLIVISFSLLYAYNAGIYKTLNINLDGDYYFVGATDVDQGGESTIEVEQRDDGIYFKCEIKAGYQWPYCLIKIHLVSKNQQGDYQFDKGLNLSSYDEVFIDANYKGVKPERLRLYLRNYNATYTDLSIDNNSMKVNELEFSPNNSAAGEYFKLKDFNVASWWSSERQLPANMQGHEFTNVPLIEIVSSSTVKYGEVEVIIRQITFRSQYISQKNLLLIIITMWLGSALIYLLLQIGFYHLRLNKVNKSQHRLLKVMHALRREKNEIDKISKRDTLTNLRNRTGLRKHFSECSIALIEKQIPFSIIFIDIDFFKEVNDIYGHNMGDDVLVCFSQLIYNNIRIEDKLGRWGGEEFILICKNSKLTSAIAAAEKLCHVVGNNLFAENLKITASFGVAEKKLAESTKEFIERADKALYKAKSNGRNQVQFNK